MRFFLVCLVVFLATLSHAKRIDHTKSSQSPAFGKSEGFPWPWSYQCKFDWDHIKGQWQISGNDFSSKQFTMDVFKLSHSGENFLMVSQWDENGTVIARGLALPDKRQRGVMIPMQWTEDSDKFLGYWLHISWIAVDTLTQEESESFCQSSRNELQLAVKIIPFGQNQDESPPKILKKILSKAP